ncbi:MAG: O-antigen polymerase [Sedimentibacter sp.]
MIFVYILLNLVLYHFSKVVFKEKINPISIYSSVWVLMLIAFELKLIKYYDLTFTTWSVLISFQLAYSIGCIAGHTNLKKNRYTINRKIDNNDYAGVISKKIEKRLELIILVLSAISALAIIPNLISLINRYGINIFEVTNKIYSDRLTGNQGIELIPYIGTIIHMAVILSGIYISRYGVKLFLAIPILLMIINVLPSGGRSDFVLGFLYIAFPILISVKKIIFTGKQKFRLLILILSFVTVFSIITSNRSAWITINPYMSSLMVRLVNVNPAVYKMYAYFSSPIGVLNAYLKDPAYNFGINSFGAFISVLNKLGANLDYQRYQDAYNIPIATNVGTYIRELIQDFTLVGGIIVIMLFGYVFARCYSNMKRKNTFTSSIYVDLFCVIIFMSFFVWFYRETVFWIITVIGIPIGLHLDAYTRKINNKYAR